MTVVEAVKLGEPVCHRRPAWRMLPPMVTRCGREVTQVRWTWRWDQVTCKACLGLRRKDLMQR